VAALAVTACNIIGIEKAVEMNPFEMNPFETPRLSLMRDVVDTPNRVERSMDVA